MEDFEYLKDLKKMENWSKELDDITDNFAIDIVSRERLKVIYLNMVKQVKYLNSLMKRKALFCQEYNFNKIISIQNSIINSMKIKCCDNISIDDRVSDVEMLRNITQLEQSILCDLQVLNIIKSFEYLSIISQENVIMTLIHSIDLCYIFDNFDFYTQLH